MDEAFLGKSMFTWYKEMLNLDQQVTDETIIIAAQAICEKMGDTKFEITSQWVSKFKDRYGIKTEGHGNSTRRISALWRAKRRRKFSAPEPSQELLDKRARFGKSYAVDEDSDQEGISVAQTATAKSVEVQNEKEKDPSPQEKEGGPNLQAQNEDISDTDSLCGFSFEELSSVPEYKPNQCEQCSERYLWGYQLKEHMKCHSDVRACLCTECGKSYKSPHNLKIHMRIHTGDRPYVCPTCDKGFREHGALVKHIRIHTGERPFLCSECGVSFISKTQLNIHLKTHLNGGEKPTEKSTSSRTPSHTSGRGSLTKTASAPETNVDLYADSINLPSFTPISQVTSESTYAQQLHHQQHHQHQQQQLIPGTGFYVPSSSAGSISSGTPMAHPSQYATRPNIPQSIVSSHQDNSHLDSALPQSQEYVNSAAAAQSYMFQDYYYNV